MLNLHSKELRGISSKIKHVIFVVSGKGGVGKSSVSVNLAVALSQLGHQVGLLDVDIHGPSVANLLHISEKLSISEESKKLIPAQYNETLRVLSMDSIVKNRDDAIIWRGPKKTAAIRQFLTEVEWGNLDFLIIDSPPGTGDEHITIMEAMPQLLCLIVTTPQEISLADVRKAINFFKRVNTNFLGLVENMSGLSCPHCGEEIDLFKKGGGQALAQSLNIPFLASIPLDPATVIAADRGEPIVSLSGDFAAKKALLELAVKVEKACI